MAVVGSHYLTIFFISCELGKKDGRVLSCKLRLLLDNADQIWDDGLELVLAFWEHVHEGNDAAADVDVHAPVSEAGTGVSSVQARPIEEDCFLDVAIKRAGGELVLIKAKLPEAWSSAECVQGSQSIHL